MKKNKFNKYAVSRVIVGIIAFFTILLLCSMLSGCETREAEMVSHNLSLEADNFNNVRQITVINSCRTSLYPRISYS